MRCIVYRKIIILLSCDNAVQLVCSSDDAVQPSASAKDRQQAEAELEKAGRNFFKHCRFLQQIKLKV